MSKEINNMQLEELDRQLSCPTGPKGIEVAAIMHQTNIGMTREAIKALDLKDYDEVLELGHGNCGHLAELLQQADMLSYYGLELSETMYHEAIKNNQDLIKKHNIHFQMYDGKVIPYRDNTFNKIMTVNTIYFWKEPAALLAELYRVLKSGGLLAIVYAQKKFMQQLPCVNNIFKLYDNDDMKRLVSRSTFKLLEITNKTEKVKSKDETYVERAFSVAVLKK